MENPLATVNAAQIPEWALKGGHNLLARLFNRKITMPEFLTETAYLALKCGFDDLRPKSLPTKPDILVSFENLDDKERKESIKSVYTHPEVEAYFNSFRMVNRHNKESVLWLEDILSRLKEGDPQGQIVRGRINEFKDYGIK